MVTSLKLAAVTADALGLADQTVIQHVKNLQAEELLTSTGRGRGAAQMNPVDAARLIIAAAGSDLVKDSAFAVRAFGQLLPLAHRSRPGPHITLEDHLAGILAGIAAEALAGPDPGGGPQLLSVSLSLLSTASVDPERFPRVAIARKARGTGVSAISFATRTWSTPVLSAADYAVQLKDSGLIRERHVTTAAMEKIARSL
ncbi:hypothetical protein QU42_19490 [Bradyrhizobium sp. UASWS1016]|jgi:hypothetical protein|uniref:hypothetical protein n=1 Tax=Bradyrhizobium sp. UASWS1016 TaxID=1566379 RepID=UPI000858C77D|nr:hypothetical protein [Bradyrhizobium sp. UASWS1016]OCX29121.1 hypothetical protein QU42_19490 [Bradyrhizobium sp. UASWS1016]